MLVFGRLEYMMGMKKSLHFLLIILLELSFSNENKSCYLNILWVSLHGFL